MAASKENSDSAKMFPYIDNNRYGHLMFCPRWNRSGDVGQNMVLLGAIFQLNMAATRGMHFWGIFV